VDPTGFRSQTDHDEEEYSSMEGAGYLVNESEEEGFYYETHEGEKEIEFEELSVASLTPEPPEPSSEWAEDGNSSLSWNDEPEDG
jgi:hypothetical protein